MDLDVDVYWCAVKGAPLPELVAQAYGPNAALRAPGADDTVLSRFEAHDGQLLPACFTKGSWTFFVASTDIFEVETMFPGREVLKLYVDSTNCWSSVEHWANGAIDWSVYGAMEDDYVRPEGNVPVEAHKFLDATKNCHLAAFRVAHAVTGFRHDKHERPKGFRIVQPQLPCELVRSGEPPLNNPTFDVIRAALEHYLATPGSQVTLTVGESDGAVTVVARWETGSIVLDHAGRHAQRKQPMFAPVEPSDVVPCFHDLALNGRLPTSYLWLTPD